MRLWLVFILIFCVSVSAQESIQTKSVYDFSGGLVNSLSNSLMQDNQATRLEDFDVTAIGNLTPRSGFDVGYYGTLTGNQTAYSFAQRTPRSLKYLYLLRMHQGALGSGASADSGSLNTLCLIRCNDANSTCTTLVTTGFWDPSRRTDVPYSDGVETFPIGKFIHHSFSEPFLLFDTTVMPLRPVVEGQPMAVGVFGGGNMTGIFRYRYAWKKANTSRYTNEGAISWPVYVDHGKVTVYGYNKTNYTPGNDSLAVLRDQNYDKVWRFVGWAGTGSPYLDTAKSIPKSDSLTTDTTCCQTGMTIAFNGAAVGVTVKMHEISPMLGVADSINFEIGYAVQYMDSLGTWSQPSTASHALFDPVGADTVFSVTVSNIPVPTSGTIIKKRLLRRVKVGVFTAGGVIAGYAGGKWHHWQQLPVLKVDTTTIQDNFTVGSAGHGLVECPNQTDPDSAGNWQRVCIGGTSTQLCYWKFVPSGIDYYASEHIDWPESTLAFQPVCAAAFNSRLFAAGDQLNPNYLYYSDIGRPWVWPSDHILAIPSAQGDWINGLYSLGEILLIFRQNTVLGFTGASFYQFQLSEASTNCGLSASRTLSGTQNEVFFAHRSGLYAIQRGSVQIGDPVSLPIQNTFDTLMQNPNGLSGNMVGTEYWLHDDDGSGIPKTYIYARYPRPHWKVYSFGAKSVTPYDPDSLAVDFSTKKHIIVDDYNRTLLWGFSDNDTTDTDVIGDPLIKIRPLYQSKYFFEGPSRTKIQYVDIAGTGAVDSVKVSIIPNYGTAAAVSTVVYPDFSSQETIRAKFGVITKNAAVRIQTYGGRPIIKGYTIGYTPWDGGKL